MALDITLSNPALEVNDEPISYVPGSLTFSKGQGDKKVRASSAGGKAITTVVSHDASTHISKVKFKLYPTQENLGLVDDWMADEEGITIRLSQNSITVPFRKMVVITEPEKVVSADGDLEVEFNGQPVT